VPDQIRAAAGITEPSARAGDADALLDCSRTPGSSFFLFGPRGTGRSTWLRETFPTALWLDLLEPDIERELSARPERLRAIVEGAPRPEVVVVDEVQRAPEVLTVVHQLLEEKVPRRRFVLTGSSARKLKRTGVDLLGGRALRRAMHP
jgi:predicted AAA+ superfamily ATPase